MNDAMMTPAPHCDINPACEHRLRTMEARQDKLENEVVVQGKELAAVRAQVALAAGLGSVVGGSLVGAILHVLK